MKKKIKDLTLGECKRICEKQTECFGCPLETSRGCATDFEEMEREVEIDE
jgi:hypothetical protein